MSEQRPIEPTEILERDGSRVRTFGHGSAHNPRRRSSRGPNLPALVSSLALAPVAAAGVTAAAAVATLRTVAAMRRMSRWSETTRTPTSLPREAAWESVTVVASLRISWTSVDLRWPAP